MPSELDPEGLRDPWNTPELQNVRKAVATANEYRKSQAQKDADAVRNTSQVQGVTIGNQFFADPTTMAAARLRDAGITGAAPANYDLYQKLLRDRAMQATVNPFDAAMANQARAQQTTALDMMRKQLGQSSVGMQGAAALAQANQQALRALAGQGALAGRTGMGAVAGQGAGIAGDVAGARLREYLSGQQGVMQGASGLRGADIASAMGQGRGELGAAALTNSRGISSLGLGSEFARGRQHSDIELYKLYKSLEQAQAGQNMQTLQSLAGGAATVGGMALGDAMRKVGAR